MRLRLRDDRNEIHFHLEPARVDHPSLGVGVMRCTGERLQRRRVGDLCGVIREFYVGGVAPLGSWESLVDDVEGDTHAIGPGFENYS